MGLMGNTEWIPETGYASFDQAKQSIWDYIIGYYSQVRPHRHNDGHAPNQKEKRFWLSSKSWPNLLDHYTDEAFGGYYI